VPPVTEIKDVVDKVEIDRLCETLNFPIPIKPRDGTSVERHGSPMHTSAMQV
jgi:hypothetical protein